MKKLSTVLILLCSIFLSSCSVVGGIFKAGMGFGIFLVVVVVIAIIAFVAKAAKNK